VSRPLNIDWDKQPLGQVSDAVLARRLGCSPFNVAQVRRRRGITAYRFLHGDPRRRKVSEWSAVPLGTRTDVDIARELGVSPCTVRAARGRLGIPPFVAPSRPATPPRTRGGYRDCLADTCHEGRMAVLRDLKSHRYGLTIYELAERHECTTRTIHRALADIRAACDVLATMGIPARYVREGGECGEPARHRVETTKRSCSDTGAADLSRRGSVACPSESTRPCATAR